MKQLHRKDLFGWSEFNPERNLDFHSVLWVRAEGNVLIDPLPLSAHDQNHLRQLGGAKFIVITNSDHCRDAFHIAKVTGAIIYAPEGERENFPVFCEHWVTDNQEIVSGLIAYQLNGSKTPGELALVLENSTLITGDLIRCHSGGSLCLLPETKLTNIDQARQSVKKLADLPGITTVLVGDGWPLFNQAGQALKLLTS
jgi:Metallo-beta-lactamase superfamily